MKTGEREEEEEGNWNSGSERCSRLVTRVHFTSDFHRFCATYNKTEIMNAVCMKKQKRSEFTVALRVPLTAHVHLSRKFYQTICNFFNLEYP